MSMPESTCPERVGGGTVTYSCSLPMGHAGPHYAVEVRSSVIQRTRWEQAQRHEASPLAQFQGPAQTTAERYTENPTPVPQSDAIMRQDAREALADQDARAGLAIQEMREARVLNEQRAELAVEPTKQREGDQALPTPNHLTDIQTLVIQDHEVRRRVGISRYGTALQPFNGRDTIKDAYEEALDLSVYLRSLMAMRDADREEMVDIAESILISSGARGAARALAERIVDAFADRFTQRGFDVQ